MTNDCCTVVIKEKIIYRGPIHAFLKTFRLNALIIIIKKTTENEKLCIVLG